MSKTTPRTPTYRFTRPGLYDIGTPGWRDASARQGYYASGDTVQEALDNLAERYPDKAHEFRLDTTTREDIGSW